MLNANSYNQNIKITALEYNNINKTITCLPRYNDF